MSKEGQGAAVFDNAANALLIDGARPLYTVCTLVNNAQYYADMLTSFREKGFTADKTQYIYVDNTGGNGLDAYAGLNLMLFQARGSHVILCHQDVRPVDDEPALRRRLEELGRLDPRWALAGNAGRTAQGKLRLRLTDYYRYDVTIGAMPAQVVSLDENFIVKKGQAQFGLSSDLAGYHFYGADLVTQAKTAGWNAYVIDFHLLHFGLARTGQSFKDSKRAFEAKYETAFTSRPMRTTVIKSHVGRVSMVTTLLQAIDTFWSQSFAEQRRRFAFALRDVIHRGRYTLDGTSFVLPDSASVVAKREIAAGRYELPERTLVQRHLPQDLPVIELGGAYGIVSRIIGRRIAPGTKHVVVEANPELLAVCRQNASNGAGHEPVIVNAAVSYGAQDTIAFTVTPGTHDSHLSRPGEADTIHVPVTTVGRLRQDAGIGSTFSLVVDIEGAEYELFSNDAEALSHCAWAIIEVHPCVFAERGQSEEAFLAMVAEKGFDVVERIGTVVALKNRRVADQHPTHEN